MENRVLLLVLFTLSLFFIGLFLYLNVGGVGDGGVGDGGGGQEGLDGVGAGASAGVAFFDIAPNTPISQTINIAKTNLSENVELLKETENYFKRFDANAVIALYKTNMLSMNGGTKQNATELYNKFEDTTQNIFPVIAQKINQLVVKIDDKDKTNNAIHIRDVEDRGNCSVPISTVSAVKIDDYITNKLKNMDIENVLAQYDSLYKKKLTDNTGTRIPLETTEDLNFSCGPYFSNIIYNILSDINKGLPQQMARISAVKQYLNTIHFDIADENRMTTNSGAGGAIRVMDKFSNDIYAVFPADGAIVNSSLNNLKTIRCNNGAMRMNLPIRTDNTHITFHFVVSKANNDTSTSQLLATTGAWLGGNIHVYFTLDYLLVSIHNGGDGTALFDNKIYGRFNGSFVLSISVFQVGSNYFSNVRINGRSANMDQPVNHGQIANINTDGWDIIGWNEGRRVFNGYIGEFIYYNTQLAQPALEQNEALLSAKWNIPLTYTPIYPPSAPIETIIRTAIDNVVNAPPAQQAPTPAPAPTQASAPPEQAPTPEQAQPTTGPVPYTSVVGGGVAGTMLSSLFSGGAEVLPPPPVVAPPPIVVPIISQEQKREQEREQERQARQAEEQDRNDRQQRQRQEHNNKHDDDDEDNDDDENDRDGDDNARKERRRERKERRRREREQREQEQREREQQEQQQQQNRREREQQEQQQHREREQREQQEQQEREQRRREREQREQQEREQERQERERQSQEREQREQAQQQAQRQAQQERERQASLMYMPSSAGQPAYSSYQPPQQQQGRGGQGGQGGGGGQGSGSGGGRQQQQGSGGGNRGNNREHFTTNNSFVNDMLANNPQMKTEMTQLLQKNPKIKTEINNSYYKLPSAINNKDLPFSII